MPAPSEEKSTSTASTVERHTTFPTFQKKGKNIKKQKRNGDFHAADGCVLINPTTPASS